MRRGEAALPWTVAPGAANVFRGDDGHRVELFRDAGVKVAVCEVGLGGRLDATNVLAPVVTAITSIGHDHQQYLGATLPEIAAEKAGIIKSGVPVIVGAVPPEAAAVITRIALRTARAGGGRPDQ